MKKIETNWKELWIMISISALYILSQLLLIYSVIQHREGIHGSPASEGASQPETFQKE